MSNRPARFTEVDLLRAGRAAAKLGEDWTVEARPDGTIALVRQQPGAIASPPDPEVVEPRKRIRLC